MLNIETIHDIELKPFTPEEEDIDLAVKNYLLFTTIGEEVCIALSQQYLTQALDYLSKKEQSYKLVFLDEDSYNRLYNRFLEARTDREFSSMENGEKEEIEDDDISLTEFLRNSSDLLSGEESAPVIKFVNSLLYQAIKKNASDIHIEAHEYKSEVRFRVDGVLTKHVDIDNKIANLIISRIKVISNLDISEKRIPQDGRTQVKIAGKSVDIRVSILPTYYGERVVMRMLMQSENIPHLAELGFNETITQGLADIVKHSHGIILVTGPTGSGKSTTLHACLQQVATPEKNIITIEDPVEYKADNVNQIQVNTKAGLTFASGLRSILRQDPDIIMVGEIRDKETAQIAIQAALTGHLVFSTLHTNNATASITRLIDMGIERFLIASSLLGVLAQRLVRTLCPHCKIEDTVAEEYATELDIPKGAIIYKAHACPMCNYTGYIGRVAIGEFFAMDDDFQALLKETNNDHTLRQSVIEHGMAPLASQLKAMLLDGSTSMDEIIRVGAKEA